MVKMKMKFTYCTFRFTTWCHMFSAWSLRLWSAAWLKLFCGCTMASGIHYATGSFIYGISYGFASSPKEPYLWKEEMERGRSSVWDMVHVATGPRHEKHLMDRSYKYINHIQQDPNHIHLYYPQFIHMITYTCIYIYNIHKSKDKIIQ